MISQKGDKKVETWEHSRTGFETAIYLRGTSFVATLLEKNFEAPDITIIRHQMSDYAEHWLTMEWFPILEIEVADDNNSWNRAAMKESFKFEFDRFLISKSPAGNLYTVKWNVHKDHRKAEMNCINQPDRYERRNNTKLKLVKFPLVAPLSQGENKYWMTYTDALWRHCEYICSCIQEMRKQIREMVTTNEGLTKFLAIGTSQPLQLTAPTKKKK